MHPPLGHPAPPNPAAPDCMVGAAARMRTLITLVEGARTPLAEAREKPTEETMIAAAKRMSEGDFIAHFLTPRSPPRVRWQAYDEAGNAIAAFGPDRAEHYRSLGYEVRELVPSRHQLAAYEGYRRQREALRAKFRAWAESGRLSEWWGFDPNEVTIYHHRSGDMFVAQWRGKRVGALIVDVRHKDDPPDLRRAFKVVVDPHLRRRGIATRLYDAAAAWLAKDGMRLGPSKAQYPDGNAFWRLGNHPRLQRTPDVDDDPHPDQAAS